MPYRANAYRPPPPPRRLGPLGWALGAVVLVQAGALVRVSATPALRAWRRHAIAADDARRRTGAEARQDAEAEASLRSIMAGDVAASERCSRLYAFCPERCRIGAAEQVARCQQDCARDALACATWARQGN